MIKWNNINLKDKGIIVEKTPSISKAKKKIDIQQIPGRNGFISIDTGVYEPFNMSLECHCNESANLDEIKSFLDGYGTLSVEDGKQYTAVINNTIPFDKVLGFKKFVINFLVNPIAEDTTVTELDLTELESFVIDSYEKVYPIITIECEGDITVSINENTFYLKNTNGTYILDCKNKIIKDSNGVNASNLMLYDFPYFKPGSNNIDTLGTIVSIVASYRNTYL